MAITINKTIQQAINEMKEKRTVLINHKGYEIYVHNNNWPSQYHLAVKDEGGSYIYESSIPCKSDVMLYKNIEMIIEYLG